MSLFKELLDIDSIRNESLLSNIFTQVTREERHINNYGEDSAYISPFYTLSTILPSNQYMEIKLNERGGEIEKDHCEKYTR
jgi:hypothetical protein